MHIQDTLEGFWLSKRRNLSENTINDYSNTFRRFIDFIGDKPFEAITATDVETFLDHAAEDLQLSSKTLANYWTALSSLWTWAERTLNVPHVLRNHVDRPKVHRRQTEPYTQDEVRAMLDACDKMAAWDNQNGKEISATRPSAQRDKAILMVLLDVGLRVSELCDLRLRDYDRKRGQLTILHGKGDKKRIVYLGESARTAVWRYLVGRKGAKPEAPLFETRDGGPMDRGSLMHLIQRVGQRAGVEHAGPHRFRHTFAINYLRNGGNLFGLQAALGHEKLDTVRIYARLAEVDLEKSQRLASPADNWKL